MDSSNGIVTVSSQSSTMSLSLICIMASSFLAIAAVLILSFFLYKKLDCRHRRCCSVVSVETPNDTNRLTSSLSFASLEYDGTNESGYVGGQYDSSVNTSTSNIQSCSPLPSSSQQLPSLSRSTSICSFFSIDETTRSTSRLVQFVSREVQTDPVTIVSVENDSSKITEAIPFRNAPIGTISEQPKLDGDGVCMHEANKDSGKSELSSRQPTSQPLFHFDNFGELAEFVQESQQFCPSESVCRINRDNILQLASSVKESLSSSATTVAFSQPSSSTKRKWEEKGDNNDIVGNYCKVRPTAKKDNSILVEFPTPLKDKSLFISATETRLKHQQKDLVKLIEIGHIRDTSHLKEIESALEWIAILRETLLGVGDLLEAPQSSSLTEYGLQQCIRFLQDLQKSQPVRADKKLIYLTQKLLLFPSPTRNYNTLPVGGYDKNLLVIGVDATPNHFGGYCVNLKKKCIEFYIINAEDIPWEISHKLHSDEFEMKNFILSLCIWHRAIEEHKTFSVFTDNNAILTKNKYGSAVEKLIQHLVGCKGAKFCNENQAYVNRIKDLASFATHIQPADDLSRRQIRCMEFLCEFYSIGTENVRGTHQYRGKNRIYSKETSCYEIIKTKFYNQALKTAREFIHTLECPKCFGVKSASSPLFQDLRKMDSASSTSWSSLSMVENTESSMRNKVSKGRKRSKRKKSKAKGNASTSG